MANAVLVVDMLRGFLEEGYPLYIGEKCRSIIPNIAQLLDKESAGGAKIYFICDNHAPDDLEFKMFPPHCIEGTIETEIIPELAGFADEVIPKKRYSGFFETPLEDMLKQLNPDKLIICGVLTNICVMHTVADARNRDYEVEVPADCVSSPDEEAHRFALEHMKKILGVRITDTGV
ncbi:cysteine hydrolase family protein [Chloroflexota bacterium]